MSENESSEETTETSTETVREDCVVLPNSMKPLFECCKDYSDGKIDSSDFFAKMLQRTGEFMQKVKKKEG